MLMSGSTEEIDVQRKVGNPFGNTLIELKTAEIGRNIYHLWPIYFFTVFYPSLPKNAEKISYPTNKKSLFALKLNLAAL